MARRKVTNGQFLREPWFRLGVTSILDALNAPKGSEHDLMNMSATSSGAILAGTRVREISSTDSSMALPVGTICEWQQPKSLAHAFWDSNHAAYFFFSSWSMLGR